MAFQLWSQDIFSKGEISPLLAGRVSIAPYYNGLKTARNVITYPQGAAGKRFGTIFQNFVEDVADASQIFIQSMQYLNECTYLIVLTPNLLTVYLEGIPVQSVVTTIGASDIPLIDYTTLDTSFRICTGLQQPMDITRTFSAQNIISAAGSNLLTLTTPVLAGLILPVRFNTTGTLPTTVPQILLNKTYFVYYPTSSTAQIYGDAVSARLKLNPFVITDNGTGVNVEIPLNNWAINPVVFRNVPTYDFNEVDYEGINTTFTLSALSGNSVTLTCNIPVFIPSTPIVYTNTTTPYIGGTFSNGIGGTGGGIARIISVTSSTVAVVNILASFVALVIPGANSFLTQLAWTNERGWPACCSSFQNRAFFANNDFLPNGVWGSVINDYNDFDDSESDADNAISWYPSSDNICFIRFIVPYRSLTIHTNSGVFSTPLSVETAITPLNFSLTIQDSTPAEVVQPRGIDNQIVILSGNDAHSLLWDGFNNAYQSSIISVANEQVIRNPVDEAAFVDLNRAGSRYMLIVNEDGSLAIYQTLISEEVQGWTPAYMEQSYGNAYFRWVTTSTNGRGWFVIERQLAVQGAPIAITNFASNTLYAAGSNFSTTSPTAINFSTTEHLPTSLPQITVNAWYWAIGIDANNFMVFGSQSDAKLLLSPFSFSSFGAFSTVDPHPLGTFFCIEELNFSSKVDCAFLYNGAPQNTFGPEGEPTGLPLYDAQDVVIQGDGYGFEYTGINGQVQTIAHGQLTNVSIAQMGFPINVLIEPLPLSVFGSSPKSSYLLNPNHIREVNFMFADTIGGMVNGVPIALQNFGDVPIGSPPLPVNGIFEFGLMNGWDNFQSIGFTITHSDPFDFKLIGIFYKVEV